jgi:hypothetical protein
MWSILGSSNRSLGDGHIHLLLLLFDIISLLSNFISNLTVTIEWMKLPQCKCHNGFGTKSNSCVGCEECIFPSEKSHTCLFYKCGFTLDHTCFTPCGNRHHPKCITAWNPFWIHLVRTTVSLQYPRTMTRFTFSCEACTVHAVLGRGLAWIPDDLQLLMLERMWLIDMAHACDAPGDGPTPWTA